MVHTGLPGYRYADRLLPGAPSSPACCRRPRVAYASLSPAGRLRAVVARGRFFSRTRRRSVSPREETDRGDEAEKHLSDMVVSKALVAKIDRPMGIVCFQRAKDSNDILNSWAMNLEKLLDLVEKSCHQIHKETMIHKAVLKA
ncbi:hypothetical protein BHM03_00006668 [Ensete ventricosum]|nr:hypothetical protein BHM03_00006668 [Ensete ventricosum]